MAAREEKVRDDSKAQAEAFRKAARDLGCDESEEKFDAALRKVAAHKPTAPPPKSGKLKTKKAAK